MGCLCGKSAKIIDGGDIQLQEIENAQNEQDEQNAQNEQNQDFGFGKVIPFHEIRSLTDNFNPARRIREGGFGHYISGILNGQRVTVKRFNNPDFGEEFAVQVFMYASLHHQNIMTIIGDCLDEEPFIVFEDLPPLDIQLHGLSPDIRPLDWNARMKIAAGVANGLYYLHTVSPLIICEDLRSSNILLGDDFEPKLTDFGLLLFEPPQDRPQDRTADLAYRAPEYLASGELTVQSDVYSYGVVLLEIITGQRAYNEARGDGNEFLVSWVWSLTGQLLDFRSGMADPRLGGRFPKSVFINVGFLALRCVLTNPDMRPSMTEVVNTMNHIASKPYDQGAQGSRSIDVAESSRAREVKNLGDPYLQYEDAINLRRGPSKERIGWSEGDGFAAVASDTMWDGEKINLERSQSRG